GKDIMYTYDFGDEWMIKMSFLGEYGEDLEQVVLLEYAGTPPDEDSGGIWAYNDGKKRGKPERRSEESIALTNSDLKKWRLCKAKGRGRRDRGFPATGHMPG
ncbi:MAG: hypothetical protein IJ856_06035, partial [Candidatus Methanomethylophilaceae archaeon]|nr:hypothetical protein [Candidatus Methanomethylophilaceae archaeon]